MKLKLLIILAVAAAPIAQGNDRFVLIPSKHAPALTTTTSSGSVTAGANNVTFIFSADFTGTIGGQAYSGATDSSIKLEAPINGTLPAIAYTVGAGTLRIVKVVPAP